MSNENELPDEQRGLYGKFNISRTDGSSEAGGKHEHCRYFVLDLVHDTENSIAALDGYMKKCANKYPLLARDLRRLVDDLKYPDVK